ncbi:MAG TPA: branched-chain amino acid ABC transporter permease [Pyrodictium sp.]|nr:branched-chain amino acid ABC transporter permease [Pyrodictium sp.]HIQ55265.1 branched-chain amino acid ABC transporter permease [Pyrodictium sp.]
MPAGVFKETYVELMGVLRYPIHWVALALGIVTLLVLPLLVGPYYTSLAISLAIFFVGAIGLNMLTGLAGQISLAQGALMGVGAYATVYLAQFLHTSILVVIPIAAMFTAAMSIFLGLPSFRLKGYYLAMASIAAQMILEYMFSLIDPDQYTPVPESIKTLGTIQVSTFPIQYYAVLVYVVLASLLAVNLGRSGIGRALKAVGDNDVAAEIIGINVAKAKAIAFGISGFFAGLAGGLYALTVSGIDWTAFTLDTSIEYLAIVLVGGPGRIVWGSLLGATLIRTGWSLLETSLSDMLAALGMSLLASAPKYIVLGSIVAVFLVLEPEGLIGILRRVKEYFRLWPYSY